MKINKKMGIFLLVLMFSLGVAVIYRGTYSTEEVSDELVINCPDEVESGDMECVVTANISSMNVQGISGNYSILGGKYNDFTPAEGWILNVGSDRGFVLVSENETGVTGEFNVGVIKLKEVSVEDYKIEFTNVTMGDGEDNKIVLSAETEGSNNSSSNGVSMSCPDTVQLGESLECSIDINAVSWDVQGISAKYKLPDGFEVIGFDLTEGWQNNTEDTNQGFVLVNLTGVSGQVNVGKIIFSVAANEVSAGEHAIELIDVVLGDGKDNKTSIGNIIDNINVLSNVVLSDINTLDNISLGNDVFDVKFDKFNNSYSAIVYSDKVTVDAVKTDEKSNVSGDIGEFALNYGTNNFEIVVTAENGNVRIYELKIFRGYKFSSDKYIYNEENNYLYTGTDIDNDTILNNISIDSSFTKKIEGNKLIIATSEENLLSINILNVNMTKYNVVDKVITFSSYITLAELRDNLVLSDGLNLKVIIDDEQINNDDDLLLEGMKLKICFDDVVLEQYDINVLSSINTLDGISLSNGTLNEIFDKTNNSYTATVYSDKVTIDVVKTDAKSRVSGDIGEFALNYGINNFEIIVTSENDIENIYELEIFRGYKFSSDKYF